MTARPSKEVLHAAGKAEDFCMPREAGTGAISLAIGHIDAVLSARELMEKILHEAEDILRTRGIGGWTLSAWNRCRPMDPAGLPRGSGPGRETKSDRGESKKPRSGSGRSS